MGSRRFSYDANGNITGDGTKTLTYDYKNQLTNVAGSVHEDYLYDAEGLRVKKKEFVSTFTEDFDDGDIHDGDPTDWSTTGSYWDASTGELRWTSTSCVAGQCSNQDLTFDDFEADYDVKADGYCATNYWAAFAFRKTNYSDWYGTSGYMVYYRYIGYIELYRAGYGVLTTSNTGKNLSTWRHVKIVVNGANIKAYVDGDLEIDYNDGTYTSGYFGFNVFGVAARYDSLVVKNDQMVYYVRGANGEVLAEYDGGGNLLAEYVYANGQRIAKFNPGGNVDFYLNDHLGSARAMVENGWSANYYPFGELASQTGSDEDTHVDFTGHERDRGTGLIYAGARFLDPETGRWVSVDPLTEKYPGWSPYVYALNNPMIFIDPTGAQPDSIEDYYHNLYTQFQNDPNDLTDLELEDLMLYIEGKRLESLPAQAAQEAKEASKAIVKGVAKTADVVSDAFTLVARGGIILLVVAPEAGIAVEAAELVGGALTLGTAADVVSAGAKATDYFIFEGSAEEAISQGKKAGASFVLGKATTGILGKVVQTNARAGRFINPSTGQFVKTHIGKVATTAADATYIYIITKF